jgi:hypothetical protein
MQDISPNSPQALARVVAMLMVADTEIDPRELDSLEALDAFRRLGLSKSDFMQTAKGYCADLGRRMGEKPFLRLSDIELIDDVLRPVSDARARALVCRLVAEVIAADGEVKDIERRIYDHMLVRWGLTHEMVARSGFEDRFH